MKLTLLSENLQKKLSFVQRAVSTKSQLPVLLNLLLEAREDKLYVSSTDLEIGIQVIIPSTVEEPGAITVPAKVFAELINSLPAEKITLATNTEGLEVISKKTKSTFQTIVADDFPKLYDDQGEEIATLKSDMVKKDLSSVVFAASIDVSRPALSGVFMRKEEEGFLLVATDGYRLSLKNNAFTQSVKGNEETKSLLVPARILREIIAIKQHIPGDIRIFVSSKNNQVLFQGDEVIVVGRLIEAEYPNYQKIIPGNYTTRATFDKEELQKAVKICSIMARETANIVKFVLKENKIIVSANTPSVGKNTVEVDSDIKGDDNEIAFNAKYLLDLFANSEQSHMLFEMTGPLNPGVFRVVEDSSFLHIIMPIRVQA